jgi:hypothetical protein
MLMDELEAKIDSMNKVLTFFNMVQVHKSLHRQYLDTRQKDPARILNAYIPFYSDIELITLTKESIFHQIKESKANGYYKDLWDEICQRMSWQFSLPGKIVDLQPESLNVSQLDPGLEGTLPKASDR